MRTSLELPDSLFARLKARAATEGVSMKQLLQRYVEAGLIASATVQGNSRCADALPTLQPTPLAIGAGQLSNAGLFSMLEP
ncbi:MAG: hypothetical protein VKM97_04600 [Cyanobacteriota bacterium]|nr:hypothetical protein [Cyanobacteriota bacterium]